jgi:hypothetical protein
MDIYLIKNIVCLTAIIITFICTLLPSRIIYTANCKRSWIVVLIILASSSFIVNKYSLGISLILILLVALFIHYLTAYFQKMEGCDS